MKSSILSAEDHFQEVLWAGKGQSYLWLSDGGPKSGIEGFPQTSYGQITMRKDNCRFSPCDRGRLSNKSEEKRQTERE